MYCLHCKKSRSGPDQGLTDEGHWFCSLSCYYDYKRVFGMTIHFMFGL